MTGRPREMVKYAELAVANAPDSVDALLFLVQAYASGDRAADLGKVAQRLIAVAPTDANAVSTAVRAFLTVNDFAGAEAALAKLEVLGATQPEVAAFVVQARAFLAEQKANSTPESGPPAPGGGGQ